VREGNGGEQMEKQVVVENNIQETTTREKGQTKE